MKKILVLIVIVSLFISGCSLLVEDESVDIVTSDIANVVEPQEVIDKVNDGESFVFVLGNDDCPACIEYKSDMKEFYEKENIKMDYINLNPNTDMKIITELIVDVLGQDAEEGIMTPTTFFIKDGSLSGEPIVGVISAEQISQHYELIAE